MEGIEHGFSNVCLGEKETVTEVYSPVVHIITLQNSLLKIIIQE